MYGLILRAIEGMVLENHGAATWAEIKREAGVEQDVFLTTESYDDSLTYNLVGAASRVLAVPAPELLEAFGEYWVLITAESGYGSIMQAAGRSLPEFLGGLNNLHTRVGMIFPELRPPRFECYGVNEHTLDLHHHTFREGLAPMVVGLIRGLGKRFNTPVSVALIESRAAGADHDVFRVAWGEGAGR